MTPSSIWLSFACGAARLSLIPWLTVNARLARAFSPGLLRLFGLTPSHRRPQRRKR